MVALRFHSGHELEISNVRRYHCLLIQCYHHFVVVEIIVMYSSSCFVYIVVEIFVYYYLMVGGCMLCNFFLMMMMLDSCDMMMKAMYQTLDYYLQMLALSVV